jgi:hypothetical protein
MVNLTWFRVPNHKILPEAAVINQWPRDQAEVALHVVTDLVAVKADATEVVSVENNVK